MQALCTFSTLTPVALRTCAPVYARKAACDPVLCELPTLDVALAYLAHHPTLARPSRSQVVRALVELTQTTPHAVWSHLLLVAYEPMVQGLVRRFEGEPEEAVGTVVQCFLEAVREAWVHSPSISLELRAATEAKLMAIARVEMSASAQALAGDATQIPAPEPSAEAVRTGRWRRKVQSALLLGTLQENGALAELVRELWPNVGGQRRRDLYRQLLRRRARLARELRRRRQTG